MTDHGLKIRIKTTKFVALMKIMLFIFCYISTSCLFLIQPYENIRIILMYRQNILYFLILTLEFHYAK